jgi:hypothetical protein
MPSCNLLLLLYDLLTYLLTHPLLTHSYVYVAYILIKLIIRGMTKQNGQQMFNHSATSIRILCCVACIGGGGHGATDLLLRSVSTCLIMLSNCETNCGT